MHVLVNYSKVAEPTQILLQGNHIIKKKVLLILR